MKLNFKNKKQEELWGKVLVNFQKIARDDSDWQKHLAEQKSVKELADFSFEPFVWAIKQMVEPEMPKVWINYIDQLKDGLLKEVCQEKQKEFSKVEEAWQALPVNAQRAIMVARVNEVIRDFFRAVPREAREKLLEKVVSSSDKDKNEDKE